MALSEHDDQENEETPTAPTAGTPEPAEPVEEGSAGNPADGGGSDEDGSDGEPAEVDDEGVVAEAADRFSNRQERERVSAGLRLAGVSFDEIARQVGYANASGAFKAVQRYRQRVEDPDAKKIDEDKRQLELDRLDAMLAGLWPKARKGDVNAVLAVLKIQERRSRYEGLDAEPGKDRPNVPQSQAVDEVETARRRRQARRARRTANPDS